MYRKSKRELIEDNLPLVKKIANRIFRRLPGGLVEFDDLVNTGVIGLIKAVNNYDSSRARFSTYAYIKIRGRYSTFSGASTLPRGGRGRGLRGGRRRNSSTTT